MLTSGCIMAFVGRCKRDTDTLVFKMRLGRCCTWVYNDQEVLRSGCRSAACLIAYTLCASVFRPNVSQSSLQAPSDSCIVLGTCGKSLLNLCSVTQEINSKVLRHILPFVSVHLSACTFACSRRRRVL